MGSAIVRGLLIGRVVHARNSCTEHARDRLEIHCKHRWIYLLFSTVERVCTVDIKSCLDTYFVEKDSILWYVYYYYIEKIILLKFITFFSSRSKGIKRFLGEEFFRGRNFRGKRRNKKKEKEERKFLLQQRKRNASAREQLISINI